MRKIISISIFVCCLLACSILYTFIQHCLTLENMSESVSGTITQGRILHMFLSAEMWSKYPTMPPIKFIIDLGPAALATCGIVLGIYYLLGYRRKCSPLTVGLACFPVGLCMYIYDIVILSHATIPESKFGWAIALMLLNILRSVIVLAIFAGLEIYRVQKKFSKYSLPHVHDRRLIMHPEEA